MKQILFILLLLAQVTIAQEQNEGQIQFEEKTKLEIELPPEMQQFADQMPSENTVSKVLIFNEAASIYKNEESKDDSQDITMGGDNMRMQFKFSQPHEELYHSHEDGSMLHQREFMTRTFLIEKQSKHLAWKMDMEQKEILGYVCQKASFEDSTNVTTVWFTPQIAVSGGPAGFGGLPGMILEVSLSEPEMTITATSISMEAQDKKQIQKPKKGKKVSEEEFEKIVEEKQKEMEKEFGGSGNRVIIRH